MALSHLEDRPPADVPDYYPLRRRKVWALGQSTGSNSLSFQVWSNQGSSGP